jgi:thioredoxin reductase
MTVPSRNTLAIVGAGPVGLETAVTALDRGFDVHVFERGEVGAHALAWGHVKMFTPWSMNIGPTSAAHLARSGWTPPRAEEFPTGRELVECYLEPLAALPTLAGRLHTNAQVVHMSRQDALKGDTGNDDARRRHPFRLLVRDPGGRESFLHAFHLIDASGVYGQPNWAGDGGIPARGELYLAPQLSYHVDDVIGLQRGRYAGKRTLVIGGGPSAATSIAGLARLADEAPGTTAVWVTRATSERVRPEIPGDPLPERRAIDARTRELARGAHAAIKHVGGARVDGLEFNSATHRYRVTLMIGEQPQVEEVDRVLVNAGFGPDNTIYRELKVHECYASRGPMKLATALLGANAGDCLDTPSFGADVLANPEPDFYILGNKSYGRNGNFLLETGFRQAADVVAKLADALPVAAPAR